MGFDPPDAGIFDHSSPVSATSTTGYKDFSLHELRAHGVIRAVGVGMNQWEMLRDSARAGNFDCFLLAGRYTLLEQGALHSLMAEYAGQPGLPGAFHPAQVMGRVEGPRVDRSGFAGTGRR